MSRWLRWYEGTCEDGKFRVVARKSRVTVRDVLALWAFMLEDAAHLDHRGICKRDEDFMSGVLDFEDGVVESILEAMEDIGLISVGMGAISICNFDKRQFESDVDKTAAERQSRKRARDKGMSNEPVTRDSRCPDTDTDTELVKTEAKASSKKRRPISDDWQPVDFAIGSESRKVVDSWPPGEKPAQVEQFKAHHRSKRNTFIDPQDAWSTWVLNTRKWGIGRHERSDRDPTTVALERLIGPHAGTG